MRIRPSGPAVVEAVLLLLSFAVLLFCAWILARHLAWNRRQATLRALLDGADGLEATLQECRRKMHDLAGMVAALPGSQGNQVLPALDADGMIQEALKQILAHRLWIARHGHIARQAELETALEALRKNSAGLSAQLGRLDAASAELRLASERQQAAQERPPATHTVTGLDHADRSRLH